MIVVVVAGQGAALPIHAIQFLHIGHNALQLVRVVHIEIPVLDIGGSLCAVEQERGGGEVGKHDIVVKVIGRGHADGILFFRIGEDPGHRHGNGLIFVLHIPQQHGVTHRQAVALGELLMDQHLAAGFGGDGVALHHLKAAIGEIAVLLRVGVGHHSSGVLVALRHLGSALGVDLQEVSVCVKVSSVGIGAQGVPAAQTIHIKNLVHRILRDTVFQRLGVDGKIAQQGFFNIGVGCFRGRLDGKAGQHQRGHDQQKRQQREGLALFSDGIQAGPFAQVHLTATSFPLRKTSGFTCVPPNISFSPGLFPAPVVPRLPGTPLWYTTKVELRWS